MSPNSSLIAIKSRFWVQQQLRRENRESEKEWEPSRFRYSLPFSADGRAWSGLLLPPLGSFLAIQLASCRARPLNELVSGLLTKTKQ